ANHLQMIIAQRPTDVCKLLFIGTDWYRKGGDIAVAGVESFKSLGVEKKKKGVGCDNSEKTPEKGLLKELLSKRTNEGRALIHQLFVESHFLLVPSRADCVPVVIAEAASFGVPVVATNVGGISTVVTNNVNGHIFPSGPDFITEASRVILKAMETPHNYRQLPMNSFAQYEVRLNWKSEGRRVHELLNSVVA